MFEEQQLSTNEKRQLILFGIAVALLILLAAVLRGCFIALTTSRQTAGLVEIGQIDDFPPGTIRRIELPVSFEPPPFVTENLDVPRNLTTPMPTSIAPLPLFVVHDEQAGLLVFYRNSPLSGCMVAWEESNGRFTDPCYGDKFTRTGEWIEGRTVRGLDRFAVQMEDDGRIFIDTSTLISGLPVPIERAAPTDSAAEPNTTPAPEPPTPTPTTEPQLSLEGFLDNLQQALNERDFGDLEAKMRPIFLTGIYPAATDTSAVTEVIPHLESRLLSSQPAITFQEADVASLPASLTAATLFEDEASRVAVIKSSGWGLAGSGAGLLYIIEEEDAYRWAGLVVTYLDFRPLSALETIAPPPGLIYQIESNHYARVGPTGAPELLIRHDARLSLNPSATLALQPEADQKSLTLFHLPGGESETIVLEMTLMIDVD